MLVLRAASSLEMQDIHRLSRPEFISPGFGPVLPLAFWSLHASSFGLKALLDWLREVPTYLDCGLVVHLL